MLTKILFTGLVIIVVFTVARFRSRVLLTRAASGPREVTRPRSRVLAYAVAVALVASAVAGYGLYWTRWHEVVTVRVINTQSGETVTYQVHKGSIDQREFETTDGWRVAVSDAERVEVKHHAE